MRCYRWTVAAMNSPEPFIDRAAPVGPDEAAIREHAYHLWLQDGRSEGHDLEHWFKACEALRPRTAVQHMTSPASVPRGRLLLSRRHRRSPRATVAAHR